MTIKQIARIAFTKNMDYDTLYYSDYMFGKEEQYEQYKANYPYRRMVTTKEK